MIVYKSNKGKSEFLSSYNFGGKEVTYFQYLNDRRNACILTESFFADDWDQQTFCEELKKEIQKYYLDEDIIVIYTDIPENDLICMKYHLKEIEKYINIEFFLLCNHEDWRSL